MFVEVCPCHGPMLMKLQGYDHLPEEVLKEMRPQWEQCPFRGMMVAELTEEFFKMLGQLTSTSSAQVLAKLPNDISPTERHQCLQEFEAGRAHMCFVYVLKLTHLHNAPHHVFKMASLDKRCAWEAGDSCMASDSRCRGHLAAQLFLAKQLVQICI